MPRKASTPSKRKIKAQRRNAKARWASWRKDPDVQRIARKRKRANELLEAYLAEKS